MLPLYLAGAAVLGVGAYLFTHKKKIPPAVAQAAVASPGPAPAAPAPAPAPFTPSSTVADAAQQAAILVSQQSSPEQAAFDAAKAQAAAASQQAFLNQFPGTGINPNTGNQSATQFNPNPGASIPSTVEVAAAAQAASDALTSGGVFASPADQVQSAVDLLNQFTDPNQ